MKLNLLFQNVQSQVDLSKIIGSQLYKGIIIDYYIPDKRLIVEVHGVQHHKPSGFGRNKVDTIVQFNKQLDRDSRLVELCKKFEINYIQIDYTESVDFASMFRKFEQYMEDE